MKSSPPSRPFGWSHSPSAFPALPWSLVLVVLAEFTTAVAAAHRYEHLKARASESDDCATHYARRVYLEFYADR